MKFHFMIEGVTRSLTHQMVRQRTAVYAQESLRFAVKEDMTDEVALPPSLAGTSGLGDDAPATKQQRQREIWDVALEEINSAYMKLIDSGMPAEDARGLLPHNILTRLHYSTDLRALQDHAGNRLTTQAQYEWRLLWARIIEAIRNYRPHANSGAAWQFEKLAGIFKPVCYLTGRCEFRAEFDRYCSIRDRVEAHYRNGDDPDTWDDIKPGEWLLDHNAARR